MDSNKQRILLSLANDLRSGDPMRIKYATEFKNSMKNYKLTGEMPDLGAVSANLDKFPNISDSQKLVSNWNKISAPKSTHVKESISNFGQKEFVGPPSPKDLELNPTMDYLLFKYNKGVVENQDYTKINPLDQDLAALKSAKQLNYLGAKTSFDDATKLKSQLDYFNQNFDTFNDQQKEVEATKISNMVRNLKWDNVKEVKAFQEKLSGDATNKVLQKYNITKDDFYRMHKDYLKLSSEEKKKSSFRNILVDAGLELSRYDYNSALYNPDARNVFLNQIKNKTAEESMLSNMAIVGEGVIGKIYSDKQKSDIQGLDSFEKQMSDIQQSINTVNVDYASKADNIVKQLNRIGSAKYTNAAEYNAGKRAYDSLSAQLDALENQAKTKTNDLYKQHREVYGLYKNQLSAIKKDSNDFVKQTQDYTNDYEFDLKNHDEYSKKQVDQIIGASGILPGLASQFLPAETIVRAVSNTVNNMLNTVYMGSQYIQGAMWGAKDVRDYNILAHKANAYNQNLSWNTGDFDRDGNPVTTKTVKWTDKNGDWHINPTGAFEAGFEQTVHMFLTGLATKGLAAATAASANAAGNVGVKAFNKFFGTSKFSKLALTGDDILKTSLNLGTLNLKLGSKAISTPISFNIGARALTYPAVYLTTYGKTLYDNVDKFKSMDQAREHADKMTQFESLTESIVPDVFFFNKALWSPKIAASLSTKQLNNVVNFFRTSGKLGGKEALKEFGKVAGRTLATSTLDTFQEAIVEEELNFLMQSNYEDKQIQEKGISGYVRQGEKFDTESAFDLGVESLVTMSMSSALGLKGAYNQAKMQNLTGLADPKYMSYHRFNIAANANQVRDRIAKDETLNTEQKAKAFNTIAEYEGLLKTAASAIKKPSKKTLGNDEDTLFVYFKALSDKTDLENKIFQGTVSEEERKTYENADEILKRVDTENADWAKLTPEQKQNQWFKWYEEGTMNTSQMGLENSPFLQLMSLTQRQKHVQELYDNNQINEEMYNRYKQSFENTRKSIAKSSIKNIESNLKNADNLSLNQLSILRHDLLTAVAANNDSVITGYNYGEVIVPTGLEANGDTEAFKKRLVETAHLGDKIEVTYSDVDNNTKNATLVVTQNGLVIEGTNKRLSNADEITSAVIGTPIRSENEAYRKNLAKYRELSIAIADATTKELANFQKAYAAEIEKIEQNRKAENESIKQITDANGKISFEYQAKDIVTGNVVNRTAATRQAAEADIKMRHDSALRQLQSKKTDVTPVVEPQAESVVSTQEQPELQPIVLNLEEESASSLAAEEGVQTIESLLTTEEESPVKRKAMIQNYVDSIEDVEAEIETLNKFKAENDLADDQVILVNSIIKKLQDKQAPKAEETSKEEETKVEEGVNLADILTEEDQKAGLPTFDDLAAEAALESVTVNTNEEAEDTTSADSFVQSYIPVSPFITISDEISRNGQVNKDPYTEPINTFIKNLGEEISNYSGDLISMERLLTEQGVDIQAVKDKIAEYWKAYAEDKTISKKEYLDFLNAQLGGKMPLSTISWLLMDETIEEGSMNNVLYGIKKPQDKFSKITLKSFVFLLSDKEGKPIVINSKGAKVANGVVDGSGNMLVTRALPKIESKNGKYSFYNIATFNSPEFAAQMPTMYDIQQQFLSGKIDKMPVSDMSVSNGFFKDDYNQNAPVGNVTVQTIAIPGSNLQNGRAYDEDGNVVYTRELEEDDMDVIAAMLSETGITPEKMKEQNRHINSIVYLTDDQKKSLRGKSIEEIKRALKGKHYNISNTILSGPNSIQLYKIENGKAVADRTAVYDSFMKDKWYTISFKHGEGQNRKIYFNVTQKNEPTDELYLSPEELGNDGLPWSYSRTNTTAKVSAEEELKAYTWFMKSFLSEGIGFDYTFLSHPEAFATFTNSAITLFEGSNFTDLYHEAWHRFSQHFLTVEEKETLYQEAKSLFAKGELTDAELKDIEESLAEGFRSFAKSDGKVITLTYAGKTIKIDINKPKAKEKTLAGLFQKYWNFFKSLFTTKKGEKVTPEALISKYMKEAYSERTSRLPNVSNALFKSPLNAAKTRTFKVMDDGKEKEVVIDYSSLYELSQGIDYLFVSYFNQIPQFKKVNASFTAFSKQPKAQRNLVASQIYDKVLNHIKELEANETNPNRKIQYKAVIDNFKLFVEETQGMRAAFTNANIQAAEELTNDLQDSETKLETADVYETKVSQQNLSSNAIVDLVTMVPKVDKNGNLFKGPTWGLPEMAPFGSTWAAIANNLTGLTYPEMISKLQDMAKGKYPQMKYLLENLPPAELSVSAPLTTQQLKVEFEQIFNMPKVAEMITEIGENAAGDFIVKVFEAGTSASRNVINTWSNEMGEVNLNAVMNNYLSVTRDLASVEQKIAFLNDLGIVFSNPEELIKLLEKPAKKRVFDTSFQYIYNQLKEVNKTKKIVPSVIDIISAGIPSLNIKSESSSLKNLADLEIASNEDIIDDMILKANGTTDWKFKQFNYILKMSNSLNSMTYDELKALYPQFDIVKNPSIRNSVWFNHLFNIDADGTVVRNKKNALEFLRMGGLQSDKIEDGGKVTVDLLASDKLVTDFYSFIESGLEENVRFGDKSTAGAIRLPNIESIPVGDTGKIINNLYQLMLGEIAAIEHIKSLEDTLPTNSKQYKNRKQTFVFFEKMLSEELQQQLLGSNLVLENDKWTIKDDNLEKAVKESISDYFNKVVFEGTPATETAEAVPSFKQLLINAMGQDLNAVMPKVKTNGVDRASYTADELALWYYMYSVANRIDQFNMIYGDPRNYKNGSDIYKRLSAYSATGKFPVLNQSDMDRLNIAGRVLENLYAKDGVTRKFTSKFNIVQFADVPVNLSEDYLAKDMSEDLQKAWADYIKKEGEKDKGERTDASGAVTLDFYRALNILIGTWSPDQEQAYLDQVEFVKAKMELERTEAARERYDNAREKAKESYSELLVVFNPKKWQYAGSIYSTHTPAANMDMRAFLKFSIMPLIPSNIENTELEKVVENMYKTKTDLYVFQSGSKMSMDQENQKFNNWSGDKTPKFNPTVLDLYNFKEQLPIENKMKDEAIFASQMRKLLSVGIYENGKAVRSDAEYKKYVAAVKNITDLLKVEVEGKIDTPKKIVEYLVREFDKRDMPENVKYFLNFFEAENQLVDTLDLSLQTSFIQNVLFSIINNKLIRQKYTGGQYIQAPNIGFRNANFKETALYRDDDLKFYETAPGENTRSMEVKIAFSPKYEGLLDLIHPDGERIDDLDRLNEALRNEKFVEENAAKFTLVGCRIPVQGFSTIESMRVAQFLDPIAGQIIIVPNGLTIKSGSDFDIDKLNVYEPHLTQYGELIEESYESIEDYRAAIQKEEDLQSEIASLKQELRDIRADYVGTDRLYEIESMISDIERSEMQEAFIMPGKINLEELQERFAAQKANPIADLKKERKSLKRKLKVEIYTTIL